jgi:CubicO group peptidase (beta-lactamase class C family)
MIKTRNLVFFLTAMVAALAQPATVRQIEITPEKIRQIEQAITSRMTAMGVPGVTAAIGVGREVRWTGAYGMADLENLVPMKTTTAIRLGSIAKPITAVAAMQLVESGRMSLDAEVQRYVPSFPVKPWPIRIRHLLTHQSGIRHYQGEESGSTRYYGSVTRGLEIFAREPLLFEPGTRESYTTYGFNLLGAAVEAAAGLPYVDYVRERIWKPARMVTIDVDDTFRIIPGRSRGYRLNENNVLTNCALADTSNKIPAGGMISRAEDLVKFALAVNNGVLLRRETVTSMFAQQRYKDGSLAPRALGWALEMTDGRPGVGHTGGQQGITTHLILYPAEGVSIAIMANLEQIRIHEITAAVARILFAEASGNR